MLHRTFVIALSVVVTSLALAAGPELAAPAFAAPAASQARAHAAQPVQKAQPAQNAQSAQKSQRSQKAQPAASPTGRGHTLRYLAYQYATTQAGKWYCWGGAGPSCYDCSGLVDAAYQHIGITLGRTTYDMLASDQLVPISHAQARAGDLAFYGTGHVELFDQGQLTFGAHDTGTQVGLVTYGPYWAPTAFYRVKGARQHAVTPPPAGQTATSQTASAGQTAASPALTSQAPVLQS
jgi:cell wall-associated NlpC family hydrolase